MCMCELVNSWVCYQLIILQVVLFRYTIYENKYFSSRQREEANIFVTSSRYAD